MTRVPKDIRVEPLDPELARKADLDVGDEIKTLLGSYDLFSGRFYGYAAIDKATGAVLSVAYTAGVSEREVNLGVATVESARRRGLAKLLCQACCEAANVAGQIVTWDCDRRNAASGALAESLGFIEEASFIELAVPDPERGLPYRVTPEPSGIRWTARENPVGVIKWTRDSDPDSTS
jgi:GNAT superfamily N-acetyltransferase